MGPFHCYAWQRDEVGPCTEWARGFPATYPFLLETGEASGGEPRKMGGGARSWPALFGRSAGSELDTQELLFAPIAPYVEERREGRRVACAWSVPGVYHVQKREGGGLRKKWAGRLFEFRRFPEKKRAAECGE